MKISNWFRALEWVKVDFGEGHLDRFVVIEVKFLLAIYINFWNTIAHDRFHTHAFNSISFMLRGNYVEEQMIGENVVTHVRKAPLVRFISKNNNHRMMQASDDAISVTLAGPWDNLWTETFLDGSMRVLGWGRKIILSNQPFVQWFAYLDKVWAPQFPRQVKRIKELYKDAQGKHDVNILIPLINYDPDLNSAFLDLLWQKDGNELRVSFDKEYLKWSFKADHYSFNSSNSEISPALLLTRYFKS